jgi:type IV secretion system protein VirB6
MSAACPTIPREVGLIRSVLGSVDCNVRDFSQAGYHALTAPGSLFPAALTVLLTVYVAVLGYRLMFGLGGVRLADAPLIGLRVGVVLAVSLGWTAFQTLVFDVVMDGPQEVARIIGGPAARSGSALAADPLSGLQTAYDELTLNAAAFAKLAGPNAQALEGGPAMASQGLWRASAALFMSTAGVLTLAEVSAGVLTALGPLFIALFLFDASRGLFVGWIRAMATAAIAPLVCWVGAEILLVVLEPWLVRLSAEREAHLLNPDTANAVVSVVFVFACAQLGLLAAGGMIAGGFNPFTRRPTADTDPRARTPVELREAPVSRAQALGRRLEGEATREAPPPRRPAASAVRSSIDVRSGGAPDAVRLGGEPWRSVRRLSAAPRGRGGR